MMRLVLVLVLVIMTFGSAFGQQTPLVTVDQEITLNEVLALVRADYPGLEGVSAARQAGDLARAQQLLIQHFATRTKPVIPPATAPGIGEGNSTCMQSKTSPEQAEKWLKHEFTLSNNDAGKQETYEMGPEIQWTKNPSAALSWILYLNQLNHLNALSGLYRETKDEKLAQEIGHSVLTWSQQCPRGYGYMNNGELVKSGMEVRNRLCNLIVTYEVVRQSPSLTPEMHLAFWKVFIASARELQTYEGVSYPGLIPLAVMYPEFTESVKWMKSGEENLRFALINRTSPDGAWDTQSISYQTVSVPWALRCLEFLQANPGSGSFSEMAAMTKTQVGKLLSMMLWITMPNGGMPNVGDTYGRADWSGGFMGSVLTSYIHSQMTPEQQAKLNAIKDPYERMKAALAEGGSLPGSTGFPASGYYVIRSGWEPQSARYLYFDVTPQAMGHAHNDGLHFDLYGYGKPLLADAGDYFLGWGYRAALHNTIEVDGQDQLRGAEKAPMMPREWLTTSAFDLADMAQGAYEHLKVTHRRKLVFVKPDYYILCDLVTGEGSHKLEQFFHFAGATQQHAAKARIDETSLAAVSENPDTANVQVVPAHAEGLKAAFAQAQETTMKVEDKYTREAMLGWMVTGGCFQRVKAPVAVYTREGTLPQAFYDVLYPTPAGAKADIKVTSLPVTQDGKPVPPTLAACLQIEGKITKPKHDPDTLQPVLGPNLARQRMGLAEINQGDIAATSGLLTDGDPSAQTVSGAVSSSPYTPNVLLKGRFTVDFGDEVELNYVVLHHGTWNGSQILYPPEKMTIEYWDGTKWVEAPGQQTTWRQGQVSQTSFSPVRTMRISAAVERPAGGRLALREFEAYRVPEAELQRVAALRAEVATETFTDLCLISHDGAVKRQYGDYAFDGELALIRRDGAGKVTQVSVKDATMLSNPRDLAFGATRVPISYCNIRLNGEKGVVEYPLPSQIDLSLGGKPVALTGLPVPPAGQTAPAGHPEISEQRVAVEPAQQGFAGAQPSALVTWKTDRPTTSQVFYGDDGKFGQRTALDTHLVTDHKVQVYFLRADRKYQFRLQSWDAWGGVTGEAAPQ
ncbi:MAG: alginate lyase family protein [Armatimonadia bacterium]